MQNFNGQTLTKEQAITAYKAFDSNLRCRGFQYVVGETYQHTGDVLVCGSGFHACRDAGNLFKYYSPAGSRFCEVKMWGTISEEDQHDKTASSHVEIVREITLLDLVNKFNVNVSSSTGDWAASSSTGYKAASSSTGYKAASSSTGYRAASSSTGNYAASSSTGDYAASSSTGDYAASSSTGNYAASSSTGYRAASSSTGDGSVACGLGFENKAMGGPNSAIVLVHRDDNFDIVHIRATKVGENGVEPFKWYMLDENANFVEVQEE